MARPFRLLILGGTSEAAALAEALAGRADVAAVLSYAGRTEQPKSLPIPTRVGGFGGIDGLIRHIADECVDAVIDATHPFAARMSANAIAACARTRVPLLALERPPWTPEPGDDWRPVPDLAAAAVGLGAARRRVFLAIGRLHLGAFAAAPQHAYLIRLVDAPREPLPLPDVTVVVARGPFRAEDDERLLADFRAEAVVAKNAGGTAAFAKMIAARRLRLPVLLVERPAIPPRATVADVATALDWLQARVHHARLGV